MAKISSGKLTYLEVFLKSNQYVESERKKKLTYTSRAKTFLLVILLPFWFKSDSVSSLKFYFDTTQECDKTIILMLKEINKNKTNQNK